MPNDKNAKPEGVADRPNRPNTLDLKATEIKTGARNESVDTSAEAKADAATDSTATDTQATAAAPRAGAPWQLILGAGLAALVFFAIGIGAGHWLSRGLRDAPATPQPVSSAPDPQILDRLAKLEAAAAAARQPDPQLLARIAAAEAAVKTASDMAAERERRSDEIATVAREARERALSAANAADEAAQKARASSSDQARADLDVLTGRVAALEQALRNAHAEMAQRAAQSANDTRSRNAIAAMALANAVNSGAPFGNELTAAKSVATDLGAIAALEPFAATGLPSAAMLGRELSAVMPAIWKMAKPSETPEGSFLERLQANAGKIVRIRPAKDAVGDDPASVTQRLESRAGTADIRGALTELSKLPPDLRAPAEGWIKKAEARNAAIAAAQSLSQNALTALSKSGS